MLSANARRAMTDGRQLMLLSEGRGLVLLSNSGGVLFASKITDDHKFTCLTTVVGLGHNEQRGRFFHSLIGGKTKLAPWGMGGRMWATNAQVQEGMWLMGFEAALPPAPMHEVSERKDLLPGVKEILPTMAQASAGQGLETPRAPVIPQFAPCSKAKARGCCCPGPTGDPGPLERAMG